MTGHSRPSVHDSKAPRGFTLVELLVVIAIIGILIALLLLRFLSGSRLQNQRARPFAVRARRLAPATVGARGDPGRV
jgi:prepilin-type N-terminal cleavage/methylation domain-containing protein